MIQKKCNVVFIKEDYFKENSHFIELLDPFGTAKQTKRQYVFLNIQLENNNILVPLRSNLPSNKKNGNIGYPVPSAEKPNAGLDFRKILIVYDSSYIEIPEHPKIPKSQQHTIEQNYQAIENSVIQYIRGYIKSALKKRQKIDKKYRFSTLHNFHDELGINEVIAQKEISQLQIAAADDATSNS